MSDEAKLIFVLTIIILLFSWVMLVLLIHETLWQWTWEIWLPLLGLLLFLETGLTPYFQWMIGLDLDSREGRLPLYLGLAVVMLVVLIYQGIKLIL